MIARTDTLLGPDGQPYQSAISGALGGYQPGRVLGDLIDHLGGVELYQRRPVGRGAIVVETHEKLTAARFGDRDKVPYELAPVLGAAGIEAFFELDPF